MTRKEPNLNLFLIKVVLNLLLIIHLKSARIIMLYRHTCKRPLGLFVYIFTKIYSKPSKRGFFCWGDKKTSVTVNSSLVGRSILKQCVQKSHLKVIQIGLQLGTAILRVGCQAQDSIVCEQVDFKNKDLREASKLQYCQ